MVVTWWRNCFILLLSLGVAIIVRLPLEEAVLDAVFNAVLILWIVGIDREMALRQYAREKREG